MAQMTGNEQFQQWLAQINQECGNFAARPLDGEFSGHLETGYAQGLKLSTVTTANVNLYRTKNEISKHNDSWFYTVFQLEGQAIIEQNERQTVIQPGDITLVDASRPCSIIWQQRSRQTSLLLPRSLLEQQLRVGESHCVQRLGKNLPMVQMSHRLLQESMNNRELSGSESEAALEAIVCLLRPVLQQQDVTPSRRDKQFDKVLQLIDSHLQSEMLRPEWLANETGMSVRSLYRMFANKGLVVAQYIKNRRLDLCAKAIRSATDDEKLAGIGFSWGFTDHSHFSTAFRQRFGVSPGEYRKRNR
ncbi:transcriptional regulator FeaR [Scandinavium goeteborgense]|jgi:AraC family transcriptional activator of tynA and feaB|uniref:transcriptional regulator FeaR n=1 Tax=Scandinavium goeteborgense TaxID=1851514 RepID=UPI000D7BF06D|nr:transcriptional regulator FeaR [Scandinavium goeteborgense]MCS2154054.1 transcriptional regulator FeaR [Scandinavium goeteborgense]